MKKLYLVGIIIVFLLILIMALPQIGAVCSWYTPIGSTTNPALPLFQITSLGMVLGGLVVLYWKTPKQMDDEENDEGASFTEFKKKLEDEDGEREDKEDDEDDEDKD